MKKIFTLYAVVIFSLFTTSTFSQINESFDNGFAPLTASCWEFTDMMYAASPSALVINGNGSVYSEPPVSASSVRIMRTPYLTVSNSLDVSFVYKLSNNLNGQQTRFIKIDLVDANGAIVQTLDSFAVTNAATSATSYSRTFTINVPGDYRFSVTMGGSTGGGNVRLSMDNLNVNAFVLGCTAGAATLPVHLINFQGNMNKNNKVTLQWKVADNETVSHFEIQRSTNGRDFTTIATLFATEKYGTENYSYFETVNNTEKVMYRLRMHDKQQDIDYSKILVFQNKTENNNNEIKILGNPVNDKLTLSFTSSSTKTVDVKVYDMTGRMQLSQKVSSYEGNNLVSLPLSSTFKPGFYVVAINDGGERHTAKFVKQ